jgi:hypothetical protein
MIHKALVPLRSLAAWKEHASPKSAVQWKEGRSALETARAWLAAESPGLPPEVEAGAKLGETFSAALERKLSSPKCQPSKSSRAPARRLDRRRGGGDVYIIYNVYIQMEIRTCQR